MKKVFIDITEDFSEAPTYVVNDMRSNKSQGIKFDYFCTALTCKNRLSLHTKDVEIPCICGGIMKHRDNILLNYRSWKGLTQDQLANRMGITRNYISMMESGHRGIPKWLLEAIKR